MSTPARKFKRTLPKAEITDEQAARSDYNAWASTQKARSRTPYNLLEDAVGMQEDLKRFPEDPIGTRDRIRGRLEAYTDRGPDITKPAFTASINHSSVTPYRAKYDLETAREAVVDRPDDETKPARRHKVRFPLPTKVKK
jgi:hypothetical protein